MEPNSSAFVVVSSPLMHETAQAVVDLIGERYGVRFPHYRVGFERFKNGELMPRIPETVRRQHVFFFHALQEPAPNDAVMAMLLCNDALTRASVAGITLVAPYLPYLRQDRKHAPRVPISARMLADLIESNRSVERVITADMHADQEQGFFSIPVDNLTTGGLFARRCGELLAERLDDAVVVSPDFGGAVRARRFAARLGVPVAIFEKRRPRANESEIVSLIGEPVAGKTVVIYDDMVDTGGTIRAVVRSLKELGAQDVYVCATHGIFSGGAEEEFAKAGFPVLCSDSIPRSAAYLEKHGSWLEHVSMNQLLADAVYEASRVGGSVSKLIA